MFCLTTVVKQSPGRSCRLSLITDLGTPVSGLPCSSSPVSLTFHLNPGLSGSDDGSGGADTAYTTTVGIVRAFQQE